jgi:hypothetical protein
MLTNAHIISLDANSFYLEKINVAVNYLSLDKRSYQSYAVVVFAASNTSFLPQFSFIVFGVTGYLRCGLSLPVVQVSSIAAICDTYYVLLKLPCLYQLCLR